MPSSQTSAVLCSARPHMRAGRILPLATAILITLSGVSAIAAPATGELNPWKPSGTDYYIAGLPRLNIGFTDQTGSPRVALVSSLDPAQLAGLPNGLAQAKDSDIFQPGHFQAIWSAMQPGLCKDVQNAILTLVNHSPNSAYDTQPCILNPKGYLTANFQESWENDSMQNVSGRRIRFNYLVPYNGVIFWVTSPHTCHRGSNCPTEPPDPAFSIIFTVDLNVTCTSSVPNATSFELPAACTPAADIVVEAVYGGDVTAQLVSATKKFAAQLAVEAAATAASGGTAAPEAIAGAIGQAINLTIKGIGAAIAQISDQHLRDQVSSWLVGYVTSPTLGASANAASTDFNTLFQNLYYANLGGLRPFAMGIEVPNLDLDFGLVYPLPAKPVVQNTTAAGNKGSIFSPYIAVTQPQVTAGQTIPVTCTYFRGTYVNTLNIAWNKTVLGTPKSTLDWGPPKVQIVTSALTFDATNLQPATRYGFAVRECDGLTCAPPSDILWTETQPATSNIVNFWLDNNTSQIIGKATVGTTANSFQAIVTIPAGTAPGTHQLHALEIGTQPATATINVCAPGGCGAFIGVVNTQNNTFYPPGSRVASENTVVVRGSKFAPGGSVWIWLDGVKGTHVGTAPVGPLGNFQASFSMPLTPSGQHNLVAIELKPGVKLLPVPKGKQPSIPPQDFITASVAVSVEAAAQ